MKKLNTFLVKLPVIAIIVFFIFSGTAIYLHPGSERKKIEYKSDSYSFTHNFFSDLGSFKTNPHEKDPNVEKKDKLFSMLLFNSSLILIGLSIVMFYMFFDKLFKKLKDDPKAVYFSKIAKPIGIITGLMYCGVGLVPHDLDLWLHVFFARGAFSILLLLSIIHAIAVYRSRFLSNIYAIGYLGLCIVLTGYLYVIFFANSVAPHINYSDMDLMVQVVSQKIIVLTYISSILIQVLGIHSLLKTQKEL